MSESNVPATTYKPTIAVDFDGVIHRYSEGWKDGTIYDTYVPGFFQWWFEMQPHFRVVIISSRFTDDTAIQRVRAWFSLRYHEAVDCGEIPDLDEYVQTFYDRLEISKEKPPALVTIDDRALRFTGDWDNWQFSVVGLKAFRTWQQKAPTAPD